MNAQALPSDIIRKIVCDAVYLQYFDKWRFKKGLKLLAVCHEWRCATLPLVYRNVYVDSDCHLGVRDYDDDPIDELTEELSTIEIETNVDLILSQNYVELVRILNIDVQLDTQSFFRHAKIANVLSTASAIWPNVHTLNMVMQTFMNGGTYEDIGSCTTLISDIVSRFTQLLPNVRCLMFQGNTVNPMAQIFYGNIASAYNNQLEKLTSKHPIVVPSDLVFTNLKHFDISFNGITDYQPPSINPCVLESLKMTNVFGTTYWDSFCAGEQSNVIEFSNLKRLHVSQYLSDTSINMNHNAYLLHFPHLQDLSITSCTSVLPWFFTAILPAAMESLEIDVRHKLFTIPNSFVFPVVENLTLVASSDPSNNRARLLRFINRILESTNKSSNVKFAILGDYSIINPQDVYCGNITKLWICGPRTIHDFYAFFAKLPRLVELMCIGIMVDENTEDSYIPDPDHLPDSNDMPLNICTKIVYVGFDNASHITEKMTNIVYYLLLKLPNLTELTAADVPEDKVIGFINDYKNIYPHLLAVRLHLKTPDDYTTDGYDTYY